ncbi:MAG: hypothetical protein S4CHLAM20_13560 [Chlamydiia bacterium]|nr:hypothetical protein [Chlamydiia bacterium]
MGDALIAARASAAMSGMIGGVDIEANGGSAPQRREVTDETSSRRDGCCETLRKVGLIAGIVIVHVGIGLMIEGSMDPSVAMGAVRVVENVTGLTYISVGGGCSIAGGVVGVGCGVALWECAPLDGLVKRLDREADRLVEGSNRRFIGRQKIKIE